MWLAPKPAVFTFLCLSKWASPMAQVGGETWLQCRRPRFDSWVWKIRWRRDRLPTPTWMGFPCGSARKESACRPGFDPWGGKIPWRRGRLPTPGFWPGGFHELTQTMGPQRVRRDRDFHFRHLASLKKSFPISPHCSKDAKFSVSLFCLSETSKISISCHWCN